jgi:pantetheine-phosphate adenylyltransferase
MEISAVYPGTFDPITLGHLDIIERACQLYSRVYVAISANAGKSPLFSLAERIALVRQVTQHYPQVVVVECEGLLVACAKQLGAQFIVRGLRSHTDYDYEAQMASLNRQLAPQLDTVFFMANEQHRSISSSMIRDIARYNGDVSQFVPSSVEQQLRAKFKE